MKSFNIASGKHLSRRTVLRGTGVAISLPYLDAMSPAFAAPSSSAKAKRFVGVSLSLGLHAPNFVPEGSGTDYKPSKYLKPLQDLRQNFTVVSGSSHPGVTGGHTAEGSIFSACPNSRGATSRNTVSLDQHMAKYLGHETRFPSMILNTGGSSSPSYTDNGSMIPAESSIIKLFTQLFVDDSPKEQKRQMELIRRGRSVLDIVGAETQSLKRELGPGDRQKLDAWMTSVRDLEKRMQMNEAWVRKPKPKVDAKLPKVDQNDTIQIKRTMFDLITLALQTDSTRFITLHIPGNARLKNLDGVDQGYHNLSHHGRDDEKVRQLTIVEQAVVNAWGDFLRNLEASEQADRTLLDETLVLLTSNLGNASSHNNQNMPVLLAGGGFKHGRHLAFNQKKNYPLPNLYLNTLHQLGLEDEKFATSTGEMTGLV